MFFNALVLTKKGPLGKIWLAAHYRKKLSKKDIIKVNVSESVEAILQSRILLSLRTSSHLLYGISFLLNKQVSYLLVDALEYAYCVPQFITAQGIDMEEQLENINDVNISIDDHLEFNLTQENVDAPDLRSANLGQLLLQGEAAEILCDEFAEFDVLRNDSRESVHVEEILFDDHVFLDDGFGGRLDQDPTTIFDLPGVRPTGNSTVDVSDGPPEEVPLIDIFDQPAQHNPENDEVVDNMDHIPPPDNVDHLMGSPRLNPLGAAPSMEELRQPSAAEISGNVGREEELILEPLDESYRRPKRRKVCRLIIDEVNEIASDIIKANIRDAQQPEIELAPVTRRLMIAKKTLRASVLLKAPEKCFSSIQKKLYQSHLKVITEIVDRDDESTIIDDVNFNVGRSQDIPDVINNNFDDDLLMEDIPPPPVPDEEPIIAPVVEEEEVIPVRSQLQPDDPEVRPSQERAGSQRRRKRRRLSQEQARRGTVFEPEVLHRDSDIEFERTQMNDPIPEDDFLFASQTPSEFQPTPDDGLLSQLSQTLSEPVTFSQLTQDYNRKKAASTFFQLLALHKQRVIILEQHKFYEEIHVSKGPNFRGAYVY